MSIRSTPEYSIAEEIAHTVTHGIDALLSIAGLAVLVAFATLRGDVWYIVSSSIYGATLIILYSASSLYHGVYTLQCNRNHQFIRDVTKRSWWKKNITFLSCHDISS